MKKATAQELAKKANDDIRAAVERAGQRASEIADAAIDTVTKDQLRDLLGISCSTWSRKWSMKDHSPRDSPMQKQLEATLAIKAMRLLFHFEGLDLDLTPAQIKKLRAAYQTAYKERLYELMEEKAFELAAVAAAEAATALIGSSDIALMLQQETE